MEKEGWCDTFIIMLGDIETITEWITFLCNEHMNPTYVNNFFTVLDEFCRHKYFQSTS